MSSLLRPDVLRIAGAADPVPGILPILHGVDGRNADDSGVADPEMRHRLGYGHPHTLLPYTRQDGYDRVRTERELPSIVLENEVLTATFLPGYGGRLWSLIHRPSGRELLHRNEVLQPANLALRDAWLAGGVEWNFGVTGHWPLTCEPLHAVRLTAADGTPVLRMFEFERLRRVVVQIDAWLPAGSPVLLVHVSLHNPSDTVTPVYWWSNIAVPENADTRVIAPVEHAFNFDYVHGAALEYIEFPPVLDADASYPGRVVSAADYFLDIPADERRWIAALDASGSGLAQVSTDRLRGRKLFNWGNAAGGKHWQEWLSGPDAGYLEIQAGLAKTQLEHLPMPGGATWSWAEAYGMVSADPQAVHGDWDGARAAVGTALDALVSSAELGSALASVAGFGDVEEVLARGSGWGRLEVAAGYLGDAPTPAFTQPFGPCDAAQAPWLELLTSGRLPASDPPAAPITGPRWRALLEECAADWHELYHLGLLRLADGEDEAARDAWQRSAGERPTPYVWRALAFLADTPTEAADLLTEAHRLAPELRELTIETLAALSAADRPAEALDVVAALSDADRAHGRVRLHEAKAALATGDHERVRRLLDEGLQVDNMREGELSLDALWSAVHPGDPVPQRYDFRMVAS